jgi:flagellar hook-basal body complex protein FliE
MATSPLGGIASIGKTVASTRLGNNTAAAKPDAGVGDTFGQSLMNLVENVEQSGADANQAVSNMLDKSGDVHDAMIALQRAEMTLQLTVQIRNKLVQAYQDVMRMPV